MAAPTFFKVRMLPEAKGKTRSVEFPTGTVAGNTVQIGVALSSSTITIKTPSGWTQVIQTNVVTGERAAIFELANWDGKSNTVVIEWDGSERFTSISAVSYAGTDPNAPRNATGTIKTAEGKSAEVLGLTTTVDECLLTTWVFNNNGFTVAPGSGYTEDGDQAAGPEICHKTTAVNKGVQAGVTHTLNNTAPYLTVMLALQPPQPVTISAPAASASAAASSPTPGVAAASSAASAAAAGPSATPTISATIPGAVALAGVPAPLLAVSVVPPAGEIGASAPTPAPAGLIGAPPAEATAAAPPPAIVVEKPVTPVVDLPTTVSLLGAGTRLTLTGASTAAAVARASSGVVVAGYATAAAVVAGGSRTDVNSLRSTPLILDHRSEVTIDA